MKQITISTLLLLIVQNVFGQVAIIQDADGWTYLRKGPNKNAKIIQKIEADQVFWFDPDFDPKKDNWVQVYLPKNDFGLEDCGQDLIEGFIHKSRLRPIEKIKKYKGRDLSFQYILKPFDLSQRSVDKLNKKWWSKIDGRRFFGTDGTIPKIEVEDVEVTISGKPIIIHQIFYADLFECQNSFDIYRVEDTFFIHQWNSDGAGAYEIVWVIDEHGLQQRLVGTIL
ncbi:MAG: hypothetical protein AAF985_06080 [Bacteroidota bacterium]